MKWYSQWYSHLQSMKLMEVTAVHALDSCILALSHISLQHVKLIYLLRGWHLCYIMTAINGGLALLLIIIIATVWTCILRTLLTKTMSEAEPFSPWCIQNVEPFRAHYLHDYHQALWVNAHPWDDDNHWAQLTLASINASINARHYVINGNGMKHRSMPSEE